MTPYPADSPQAMARVIAMAIRGMIRTQTKGEIRSWKA